MSKTKNDFCSCTNPTPEVDKYEVLFCKRCNKDITESMDESIRRRNLKKSSSEKLDTVKLDKDETELDTIVKCPFCYESREGFIWTWATPDSKGVENEGYCGSCNTGFDIQTGKVLDGWEGSVSGIPRVMANGGSLQKVSNKSGKSSDKSSDKAPKEEKAIKHYTNFSIQTQKWKCDSCPAEFDHYKDARDHDTPYVSGGGGSSYSYVASCTHTPTHVIDGKEEGWGVWAGKRWDCVDKANKFNIVLNLTGDSIKSANGHRIPVPELSKWASEKEPKYKFKEIVLDWPDMGVVTLPKEFWDDLVQYLIKNKLKMLMFCVGGHGRTGTAMASLLVTALGWTPERSIKWVKENYCDQAIETFTQTDYVYRLVGEKAPSDATYRKGQGKGPVYAIGEPKTAQETGGTEVLGRGETRPLFD